MEKAQKPVRYKFGSRLRSVRERLGLTLREVAGRVQVSESYISQIERDLVSPSLDTLLHLSEVLDLDPEYLFRDYRQKRAVDLVSREERRIQSIPGVRFEKLSHPPDMDEHHGIDAFLLRLDADKSHGNREYGHPGREWAFILKGQALLELGDATYTLREGDSISFKAEYPHMLRNTGDRALEAIWIITPPRKIS